MAAPCRAEVEKALLATGYRRSAEPISADHAVFHKPSGVEFVDRDGSTQHGLIEVTSRALLIEGNVWDNYTLGSVFSTALGWMQVYFYTLSAPELLSRLPFLEAEIVALQTRLLAVAP